MKSPTLAGACTAALLALAAHSFADTPVIVATPALPAAGAAAAAPAAGAVAKPGSSPATGVLLPTARLRTRLIAPAIAATATLAPAADAAPPEPVVPAVVDPKALALLGEVEKARKNTRSLTADFTEISGSDATHTSIMQGSLRDLKPNYQHVELWSMKQDAATGSLARGETVATMTSDGRELWNVMRDGQYYKYAVSPIGKGLTTSFDPFLGFFDGGQSPIKQVNDPLQNRNLVSLTYKGAQTWRDQQYEVVSRVSQYHFGQTKTTPGSIMTQSQDIFIGPDKLVHRIVDSSSFGYSSERFLTNVELNPKMTSKDFSVTLPANARPLMQANANAPQPLVAGALAPDFTAIDADGKEVKLSDYKGKTVILDFWATWCGPCQASMPHLNGVYNQVKDQDVVVLAVCVWDDKNAYAKWVTEKKANYDFPTYFDPAGKDAKNIAGDLYKVTGIPTQFVIDKDGRIAASNVGYTGKADRRLEAALTKLSVSIPASTDAKS